MFYFKRVITIPLMIVCLSIMLEGCCAKQKTFTLWQLPSQSGGQMNSYVMQTVNGKLIVIDGGFEEDASYLKGFLAALGNNVDMWFVSHQHMDHISALIVILKNPGDLKINKIYGSLGPHWVEVHDGNECLKTTVDLNKALNIAQKQIAELTLGQIMKIDGITIKVIGVKNPEIIENGANNSSVVIRLWDSKKSVLFTGDLGPEGGQKILHGPYRNELDCDYVQMAHHGQGGVDEEFYKAVNPEYCIWPTPKWLWDNDDGRGMGSGPWKTQEVRSWMDKLNIRKHYCLFDGLSRIQ